MWTRPVDKKRMEEQEKLKEAYKKEFGYSQKEIDHLSFFFLSSEDGIPKGLTKDQADSLITLYRKMIDDPHFAKTLMKLFRDKVKLEDRMRKNEELLKLIPSKSKKSTGFASG